MRFVLISLLSLSALWGCDEAPPPHDDLSSRGQIIQAKPQAAEAVQAVQHAASKAPGQSTFCSSSSPSKGLKLPETILPQRSAGLSALPEHIPAGNGQWSWVNLWAAWCAPCKQEIPLLLSWDQKLRGSQTPLRVYFVSLDDDERQLLNFLSAQPTTALRETYWLREGHERVDWLKALKVDPDTQLPGHFLVDPQGVVRCFISGAIEADDFTRLQSILSH